jgi:hypothetical protein
MSVNHNGTVEFRFQLNETANNPGNLTHRSKARSSYLHRASGARCQESFVKFDNIRSENVQFGRKKWILLTNCLRLRPNKVVCRADISAEPIRRQRRFDYRIFLPSAERASSTPSVAVRLCSSITGLISTISMETIASLSAIIYRARWASR